MRRGKDLHLVHLDSHGSAQPAPLIGVMQAELDRATAAFAAHTDVPIHYLAYQIEDTAERSIVASFGALLSSRASHERYLDINLRAGDPKLDSTHPLRDEGFGWFRGYAQPIELPVDNDLEAVRARIWKETEDNYRSSAEKLIKVRSEHVVKAAEEDPSDDFSREPAVTHLEEAAAPLQIEVAPWEAQLRSYSAQFRAHPQILESEVALHAVSTTRYFVSSERTTLQTPRTHVRLSISASAMADDGMELERYESFDATQEKGLPDSAVVNRAIQQVTADLLALRNAPIAEPWSGPAILEGRAAAVFFHEIFGHRIEGHRQKIEGEGQTFARKIGQRVMPPFINVFDDPTIARLNGVELNGSYRFDDEGVPAQRANLVEHGILRNFLMSRSPTRGFTRSNGHGRREIGESVVARQGNLVVQPSQQVSVATLKQKLLAEIVRQNKPYGLRFRDISGGYTNTERDGPQTFKVLPLVVYRVYPNGREELVRGVDIEGTPLTVLSKILAAGDDFDVFNGTCGAESGWVPVAAASPSLLVEQIEVARREKGQTRPPTLPAPPLAAPSGGSAP
ncbi:MAG TPA: TldD/PmbA family protein [Polyangiaceae bacterium]|nr:TldD/PmbA family protein [Polyangiaceae bacterium]